MPDFHLHLTTVLAATAAYFLLGAAWYGALADPWVKALGMTKEEVHADDARWVYGIQFLATLGLTVIAVYVVHDAFGADTLLEGALAGLLLGVLASLAASGDFLYEARRRSLALFVINSGYRVVALTVAGAITGALD